MTLDAGSRLGPYEILAPLGAGGMGEVYKARDTRLDRVVAVKVLPEALAADPQFRERFDREARTISRLDHPNICALYDVGEQEGVAFLVMQFLEGETLDARLKARAIAIDDALRIAIQVADALDTAHRAGIVHRDLKPANIFLARSASGPPVAKLLDFGLAKTGVPAVGASGGTAFPTTLPTTPANITAQGTILGTFQYMAPEQLEGADADTRTDIFAFGAVAYEMVTGRKAFEGKSQVSLIGAILEREPAPIAAHAPAAPPALDRIVRRCLAKDPDRRWQTASDLAHELRWVAESASGAEVTAASSAAAAPRWRSSPWWKAATAASLVLALAALAAAYVARSATPEIVRFHINPPEKMLFVSGGRPGASAAISPDGQRIAFTVQDGAQRISLWVRSIDTLTSQPLPGTEDALFPFWSPDSRSIGYFTRDKLMKIDTSGGAPQTLCDAPNGRGGAWSKRGDILFAVGNSGLSRVPADGGKPVAVTKLSPGQNDHRFPSFLPDDRHFLYFVNVGLTVSELSGVYVGSLDSADTARVAGAESSGVYAAGYLLFVRQSTLLAQPFSLTTFKTSGDPVSVAEGVTRIYGGLIAFSVAHNGTLAFGVGPSSPLGGVVQLTWIDRQGTVIDTVGPPAPYRGLELSPDGNRVAVHRHDGAGGDIWILDGPRTERFTFDPAAENQSPVWSRDGQWIAFAARRGEKSAMYRKRSNGEGSEELLTETEFQSLPEDWSPNGQSLVFRRVNGDLFTLPLSSNGKPVPVANTPATELHAQVSPDGSWVAYQAAEGPARPEIYVRPFSGGSAKYQVSTNGGAFPRWRGDGRELFYFEATPAIAAYGRVMAVDITPSHTSFVRGAPHPLFESLNVTFPHVPYHAYAVSSNGQRFLIPRAPSALTDRAVDTPIVVVLNWASSLPRK